MIDGLLGALLASWYLEPMALFMRAQSRFLSIKYGAKGHFDPTGARRYPLPLAPKPRRSTPDSQ